MLRAAESPQHSGESLPKLLLGPFGPFHSIVRQFLRKWPNERIHAEPNILLLEGATASQENRIDQNSVYEKAYRPRPLGMVVVEQRITF